MSTIVEFLRKNNGQQKKDKKMDNNIETIETQNTDALPQEVVAAKKTGQVLKLTGEEGDIYYFKAPGKADMNRYLSSAAKGKLAAAAQNLVFDLAIVPDRQSLRQKFTAKPGLMVAINNALQNAAGLNEEFEVKKL